MPTASPTAYQLTIDWREETYGPVIVAAFEAAGLPPEWGLGIARVESAFKPRASNLSGGDLRRGGAYGLMQLTYATAKGLGYSGPPEELLTPELNVRFAAKLVRQLSDRWGGSVEDIVCAYNSGRPKQRAPSETLHNYLPKAMQWIRFYAAKQPWKTWPRPAAVGPNV